MKGGLAVGLIIPDLWQQEAVRALQQGKDVVVQAPTALKSAVHSAAIQALRHGGEHPNPGAVYPLRSNHRDCAAIRL